MQRQYSLEETVTFEIFWCNGMTNRKCHGKIKKWSEQLKLNTNQVAIWIGNTRNKKMLHIGKELAQNKQTKNPLEHHLAFLCSKME